MTHQLLKKPEEITAWLNSMGIPGYQLKPDAKYGYVVNAYEEVDLSYKNLTHIPVQFGSIMGSFYCQHNQLTSLLGCPQSVDFVFDCSNNLLTSLEFAPNMTGDDFDCSHNCIASLDFCPTHVNEEFYCNQNPLLGQLQEITDFREIKRIHEIQLHIKQEKMRLSENIALPILPVITDASGEEKNAAGKYKI